MKTLIRTLRSALVVIAVLATPHLAFGIRTFSSVTASPTSTNVPSAVATNVSSTITVINGSGASTRYVGTATLSVAVSPSGPDVTAVINPTTLVFPNANTSLQSTVTVSVAASAPINTYVVSITANTNPPDATKVTPVTTTFNVVVGNAFVPLKTWNPAGANTNWSTAYNWLATGAPTSSNDVTFVDAGATVAGTINNVVDSSLIIGSLKYGQTNNSHTTLILPGVTLTVGGDTNGLLAGTGTDNGTGQQTVSAITGAGGALVMSNATANVLINQASPVTTGESFAQATLDLSGLDTFTAKVSRVLVGADLGTKGASGVLNLARTNLIVTTSGSAAPQIDVGDNTQAQGSAGIPSILLLGQTNAVFADSITVGRGKTDDTGSSMSFNTNFTGAVAYFRGTNGTASRVGTWSIGDAWGSKVTTYLSSVGTCDFSSGTVDALVDTMFLGKGASTSLGSGANITGLGTLTFSAGTIDVNTLQAGVTASVSGSGTVNANGGLLRVNTLLELANGAGSSGTLNISNAVVTANNGVIVGGGSATINMTNGVLNTTNTTARVGTIANPLNSLSLTDSTLNLPVISSEPTIVASTLTAGGTLNTINVTAVPVLTNTPSQFPVISYVSSGGGLDLIALGTLPGTYEGYISNNVVNSTIDLVITNGPVTPVMVWDGGASANWNTTTANWKTNSVLTTFQQGYPIVQFDDSLTANSTVNLTTALSVSSSVNVNNTLSNYTFTGAGSISGNATLSKSGDATLTLSETGGDNFTGGIIVNGGTLILDNAGSSIGGATAINAGTVQVGNNSANGALPAGDVANSGSLIFRHSDTLNVSNTISGSGTVVQNGTNRTVLNGNSLFTGDVTVAKGILQVGSTNGIGQTASVTVSNGATFDIGGFSLFGNGNAALTVTVSGAGFGGIGAIINSGANQTRVLHTVTMAADTTFGGDNDWDIRNSTGSSAPADAQLNGAFNISKVGTNSISLRGVTLDSNLGNINVQDGTLTFTATATAPVTTLGNSSATATVSSNGTLTLDSIGTIPTKNFVLSNGGTLKSSGTNTISSSVTLSGANNTISVGTGAQLTITTAIGGAGGGLSKNGSSVLFLPAANTYSGSTIVSGGTLALYGGGDGSIAASTNINVTSGATLDVSGRSDKTWTLATGQTLSGGVGTNGPGNINGILVVTANATFAPGTSATNTGSLSVSSNATLQGTTIMKLNAANNTSDQLSANAIVYGGALTVTNFSGTITNGQSFRLFVATNGYSGSFGGGVTLPTAAGLSWVNTLGTDGKITAVVTPQAQPTISGINVSSGNVVLNGTNNSGTGGGTYRVLSSTNVSLPLSNWTTLVTNSFNGDGSFTYTNGPATGNQQFFIIQVP